MNILANACVDFTIRPLRPEWLLEAAKEDDRVGILEREAFNRACVSAMYSGERVAACNLLHELALCYVAYLFDFGIVEDGLTALMTELRRRFISHGQQALQLNLNGYSVPSHGFNWFGKSAADWMAYEEAFCEWHDEVREEVFDGFVAFVKAHPTIDETTDLSGLRAALTPYGRLNVSIDFRERFVYAAADRAETAAIR